MRSFVGCLAAVLLLAGCTPAGTPSPSSPAETADRLFQSESSAAAAAEEHYRAYLDTANTILQEGGAEPERILPFVSKQLAESELDSYRVYQSSGNRLDGSSSFDSFRVQSLNQSEDGATITGYLCFDVSQTRLIDSDGQDVTPPDRPDRVPLEVEFRASSSSGPLLLNRNQPWSGDDFCS